MLENLPTVEQMMEALSSPISPTDKSHELDNLSVDEMIREIYRHIKMPQTVQASVGGRLGRDSSYNSSTDTYNGLPVTSQYNGASQ